MRAIGKDRIKDILYYGISIGVFYVMGFVTGKMMANEQWTDKLASGPSTELINDSALRQPLNRYDSPYISPSNSPIESLQLDRR